MSLKLSASEFVGIVRQALEDIPAPFAEWMRDVAVDVEPLPGRAECRALGLTDRRSLLGLYQGTPLTSRSVEQSGRLPDRITIYQRNIERCCSTREDMIRQIRKTVFHEVGHHFGLEEADLRELGY
jgi:predicted Zn-dependent protease with MMP-like domain